MIDRYKPRHTVAWLEDQIQQIKFYMLAFERKQVPLDIRRMLRHLEDDLADLLAEQHPPGGETS